MESRVLRLIGKHAQVVRVVVGDVFVNVVDHLFRQQVASQLQFRDNLITIDVTLRISQVVPRQKKLHASPVSSGATLPVHSLDVRLP